LTTSKGIGTVTARLYPEHCRRRIETNRIPILLVGKLLFRSSLLFGNYAARRGIIAIHINVRTYYIHMSHTYTHIHSYVCICECTHGRTQWRLGRRSERRHCFHPPSTFYLRNYLFVVLLVWVLVPRILYLIYYPSRLWFLCPSNIII